MEDWYPVVVVVIAGRAVVTTIAKLLNQPTVIGRILSLVEKVVDRKTQVDLEREQRTTEVVRERSKRLTEVALEQERRITQVELEREQQATEVVRERSKRLTEVALEQERRTTQVELEKQRRKTEMSRARQRRATLTDVASAVPSGGVLTDRAADGSSTEMRNTGLDLGPAPDEPGVSVGHLGD